MLWWEEDNQLTYMGFVLVVILSFCSFPYEKHQNSTFFLFDHTWAFALPPAYMTCFHRVALPNRVRSGHAHSSSQAAAWRAGGENKHQRQAWIILALLL